VAGTVGIVWCILWFILAYNTPAEHPRISPAELDYIVSNVEPVSLSA